MNLRIVWGLAQWVRDSHDDDVLAQIAEAADIPVDHLDGKTHWVSQDRFEAFLAGCRGLMASDDEYERACTHRLPEAYGPLRFALWAVSPRLIYVQAARTLSMVSRLGEITILEESDNHIRTRYSTKKPESALMSLSRDAQTRAIPTLWGLPPAQVQVHHRDEWGNCEYDVRWRVKLRWLPAFMGAAIGGATAAVVLLDWLHIGPAAVGLFPAFGAALGHILDLHKTNRLNRSYGESQNEALRELAAEAVEAQREIRDLSQRQNDWVRHMEAQVAERTAALQEVVDRIGKQQEDRQDRLRGVSHDLKSPLQVISASAELLARPGESDEERGLLLEELREATDKMETYLEQLVTAATSEGRFVRKPPVEIDTAELTEALRRRLKAFVHARGVRTSVFSTREAPERVVVDRLVLDRVLDNLLTNAAKYTARGSILVEIDGAPGFITFKISDTGRGIEEAKLREIFRPGGSDVNTRAPRSSGLGLSIVLRLMDEVGGKLAVMSRVGKGTTFWAHFPETPPDVHPVRADDSYGDILDRVVTIRRS